MAASLLQTLSAIVGDAFMAEGLDATHGRVTVSDRPDLAQFQCNGAMAAAKKAGKNPCALAEALIARLNANPVFKKLDIAGPGFINLTLTDAALAEHVTRIAADKRAGVAEADGAPTVLLDYGGPNIAKPMHVGHLRASIIGDSARRILSFAGYKTLGDVHLGDWGTPMGMVISELEILHPDWPYFDAAITDGYPDASPVTIEDLEAIYPTAAKACKEDEARMERARLATVDLQNGRPGYRALWRHFIDVSIAAMKKNFDALNVHFDLWKGESDVHDLIAPMVEKLKAQNIAIQDDGAIVIPVKTEQDSKEIPPLILYKRDGAVMYGTTDLATLVERMDFFAPSKILYVVDKRQHLHFEQVFRAARLANIVPANVDLVHLGFGTMNGADGKPFKTRAGGVMKLEDLIAMGVEKATQRLDEAALAKDIGPAEREKIARCVAVAAIKFADLQNPATADYIFDLDRMTAFEGKTGPYILYQAVRIKSLLAKATDQGMKPGQAIHLQEQDLPLALLLLQMPEIVHGAAQNHAPHVICDFAHRLAQAFSSFYGNVHILSDPDARSRESRLGLCALALREMEILLSLLGVDLPDRM